MWESCKCDPEPGRCADERVRRGCNQHICDLVAAGVPRLSRLLPFQQPSAAVSRKHRTMQLCQSGTSLWNRLGIHPEWQGDHSSS